MIIKHIHYDLIPGQLELRRLWVEAGSPTNLTPFMESLGLVIEDEDLVVPDHTVVGEEYDRS